MTVIKQVFFNMSLYAISHKLKSMPYQTDP